MGYPRDQMEFDDTFKTDEDCLKYLIEVKWPTEPQTIASKQEDMLPHVHKIAGLLKRWLLGTHQNFASPERLQKYLDEFTFRYNRCKSKSRGLLFDRIIEQAITREPIP